jgi:hypothetical protein
MAAQPLIPPNGGQFRRRTPDLETATRLRREFEGGKCGYYEGQCWCVGAVDPGGNLTTDVWLTITIAPHSTGPNGCPVCDLPMLLDGAVKV